VVKNTTKNINKDNFSNQSIILTDKGAGARRITQKYEQKQNILKE
jgi:hypothetical protein